MTGLRYGKTNRRYRFSKPGEKIAPEKILVIKIIFSSLAIAVLWVVSCFYSGDKITNYLYSTYSLKEWQSVFLSGVGAFRDTATDISKAYISFVSNAEKSAGIESSPSAGDIVTAKADDGTKTEPELKAEVKSADNTSENKKTDEGWRPPLWSNVSSEYGERIHPITGEKTFHTGVDIAADEGTPVVAALSGTVLYVGYDDANGNYITVDHGGGITTAYAHLKCVTVDVGDAVSPEEGIGEVGSTGISTGPHLHFEVKENSKSVNPRKYVFFKEG